MDHNYNQSTTIRTNEPQLQAVKLQLMDPNYNWRTTITSNRPQLHLKDHNYSSPCQHWSLQQVWCRPCRATLECPVHCTKCEQHTRQALWASTSHQQSHLRCLCSQSWPGMGPRSKSLQGWNNQDYKSGALIVSFCFIVFVVGFVCCSWYLVVVVCLFVCLFLGGDECTCVHACAWCRCLHNCVYMHIGVCLHNFECIARYPG